MHIYPNIKQEAINRLDENIIEEKKGKSMQNKANLSEKQIIRQLKCLVAKQQQQINNLVDRIQQLRRQKEQIKNLKFPKQSESNLQIGLTVNNSLNLKKCSNQNLRLNKEDQSCQQNQIQILKSKFRSFQINIKHNYWEKYFSKNNLINGKIPSPNKVKTSKNYKQLNFKTIKEFVENLDTFLQQIQWLMSNMYTTNSKIVQKQKKMHQKLNNQQKILKEMMQQYQTNITESQKVENKLILQIEKFKKENKIYQTSGYKFKSKNHEED